MPHAYFLEGNGGAKRRSCRPDGGVHERRNARIGITSQAHAAPPSVRPPTSNCRPQGGHPCIERMRDAHGRSNVLRPLQSLFPLINEWKGSKKQPSAPPGKQQLQQEVHVRADHMCDHIKMGIWSALEKKSPLLSRDFLRSDHMTR